MAAGAGATSGGSFESTVDRKFVSVTNTMDSIQGLSSWCIDNKKYHSLIVRRWIKCLKKSDASQKLNLFYLANDVIQNCKRKNAIVYRTAFADVLPEAFTQINYEGDTKVIKSVQRILSIWEERSVYSGTLIAELRSSLVKEESPPETPVEQKTPVESKADLCSKIVAEFVPQALIDQLSKYKRSLEEVDLREKQLAAMRVDICSSEALKKLKDKAGGKKFSKDFEEGSAQLQEFVKFFDRQSKIGPPLLEALNNADIFYEMQYKEVKIVANAYQTFANRVSHLKRKLDSLKATLPDLDESPIPSPSADAPSPTGSESPFGGLELASPDPDVDGSAMDDEAEPPAPSPLSSPGGSPKHITGLGENDNREVEDMDLSEEEAISGGIIEAPAESSTQTKVAAPVSAKTEKSLARTQPLPRAAPPAVSAAATVEGVDLGKIGSILNSLSSVIKNPEPAVESPAPVLSGPSVETKPAPSVAPQDASSLVSLLSKVDMSPSDLLSALSKVQSRSSLEGISSLLSSPAANVSSDSSGAGKIHPSSTSTSTSASAVAAQSSSLSSTARVPSLSSTTGSQSAKSQVPTQTNPASALVQALHRDMDLATEPEPQKPQSLESKIHNFLHGNPAFSNFDFGFSTNSNLGGDNLSPVTGTDTQDGTPVRDEGGGTPTQDEIMDKSVGLPISSSTNPSTNVEPAQAGPFAYQNSTQQNPQQKAHLQSGVAQNGQLYQPYPYNKQDLSEHGTTAPVAHYQPMSAQSGGPAPGGAALGGARSSEAVKGFQGVSEMGWYGDTYPDGSFQQPKGYNVTAPGGAGENKTSGLYPYRAEQTQDPQGLASQQGATSSSGFFGNILPPVPKLPPPPTCFDNPPPTTNNAMIVPDHQQPPPQQQQQQQQPPQQQQQPAARADTGELSRTRVDSVISGMVVHDHEHKSTFLPENLPYDLDRHRRHPEDPHQHPDNLQYPKDPEHYQKDLRQPGAPYFQDNPYRPPDDPYHRPGSPPHRFPRPRGRLTPPPSPSQDAYYSHDYQRRSPPPPLPPPPHYAPRRPPPPHRLEMRHPGPRPPYRPPHPAHHPPPRGPPPRAPFPQFLGPDPRLRGKRPGPRGGGHAAPMFPPKRPFLPPRY